MSVQSPVASDHQLVRLLQIGVVLEEVVEARAAKHADTAHLDDQVRAMLREAAAESATHRERLDDLVGRLEAETIPFDDVKALVEERYEADEDFDDVLYDQLCNEETAYKFYDDLIGAIETSDAEFGVDRDELLAILHDLRAEEEEGVETVARLMEDVGGADDAAVDDTETAVGDTETTVDDTETAVEDTDAGEDEE